MLYEFCVLSHSISTNALGRALAMSAVAERLGPTSIWAVNDGPVWSGAAQFDSTIQQLGKRTSVTWTGPISNCQRVVWVSKGIDPLGRHVAKILRSDPSVIVLLDLDDDDAALAEMFIVSNMKNRVVLNLFRRMHPKRIKRAQSGIAKKSHGYTFSTNALSRNYPVTYRPMARVPHVRILEPIVEAHRCVDGIIKVGTFGTLRSHKGLDLLRSVLSASRDIELHVFKGSGLLEGDGERERVVEHPSGRNLMELYAEVDVALIPMSTDVGADVQLPAKLIDAMKAGVPIVTSPTSAITEIARSSVTYLSDTLDVEGTIDLLLKAATMDGTDSRKRFEEVASPEMVAVVLEKLLQKIRPAIGLTD